MLVVLIVIVVLGIGLPVALWLISRRRMPGPASARGRGGYDEIDRLLIGDFKLGWLERAQVRKAVLGRQQAGSAPLDPALLEPACALAARVLAGDVRMLRLSRRVGWAQLGMAFAYAGCGIALLAVGSAAQAGLGAIFLLNAIISGIIAAYNAVLAPRRNRLNAERILQQQSVHSGQE